MRRPLVAVLHGAVASDAPPDERDTLRQAEEVAVALRRLGHAVTTRAVGLDLSRLRSLRALAPAAIFYLVEAPKGRGGCSTSRPPSSTRSAYPTPALPPRPSTARPTSRSPGR